MKIIDTTNPETLIEFEYKKRELMEEKLSKGKYDVNDIWMIRATDYLPEDHIMKPISQVPFIYNMNDVPYSALTDALNDIENINIFTEDEKYSERKKFVYANSPLSTQYRSTLHFTLNGLVTSHSKGNFDNRKFIILDGLSKHLGIDDFRSIRSEDTFIHGTVPISKDAIIMIDEDNYQTLLQENPWLETYNVALYKGDQKIAVEIMLTQLGIVSEKIMTDSEEYSQTSPLLHKYFEEVTNIYGIEEMKHFYSPEYRSDDEKSAILWQIYNKRFFTSFFQRLGLTEEEITTNLRYFLSTNISDFDKDDSFKRFIQHMGLDNYYKFVAEYNNELKNAVNMGIYPTNDEILAQGDIIFNKSFSNKKSD